MMIMVMIMFMVMVMVMIMIVMTTAKIIIIIIPIILNSGNRNNENDKGDVVDVDNIINKQLRAFLRQHPPGPPCTVFGGVCLAGRATQRAGGAKMGNNGLI